jgi:hypothetical protein
LRRNITALNFTPKYDELEDRIRISINYDNFENRVDFMLTRSFIIKLFPVLDDYMVKFYNHHIQSSTPPVQVVNEMVHAEDNATSITDNSNLELYKQQDELLKELKFSFVKDSKMTILVFESEHTQATAKLSESDLTQVFKVIKASIPFFSWGISHNL